MKEGEERGREREERDLERDRMGIFDSFLRVRMWREVVEEPW